MSVQTVIGEIGKDSLGIVTPHEHIFLDLTGFFEEHPVHGCPNPSEAMVTMERLGVLRRDPYALRDNLILDDFDLQIAEIAAFKSAGGNTVVDATVDGIGRDVRKLLAVAQKTGLNIVVGTGFYVGETHPLELEQLSEKEIAGIMLRELSERIQGTDNRAGFIGEIGITELINDKERKVLRAAAIAQNETGVGLEVHINPWTTNGLEATNILLEHGVKPQKICICHVDVQNNRGYMNELLEMGVFIEFDNFGKEYFVDANVRRSGYGCFVSDLDRVMLLKDLIDEGRLHQILLSCDLCLKNLLRKYGGWGYDHVLTNIVPMMGEAGISDKSIDVMLRGNPARFLDVP